MTRGRGGGVGSRGPAGEDREADAEAAVATSADARVSGKQCHTHEVQYTSCTDRATR